MGQAPADCTEFNCAAMADMIEVTNDAQQVVATTINESSANLIKNFTRVQGILKQFITKMGECIGDDTGQMSLVQGEYQQESKRQQNQSDTMQTAMKACNTEESALGDAAQQCSTTYTTVLGLLKLVANLISSPMS